MPTAEPTAQPPHSHYPDPNLIKDLVQSVDGTIPLLQQWLWEGMSLGSATAFMITGPATKITNLGAVKIVLGIKRFLLYIAFVMAFSFVSGILVNIIVSS